MADAERIDEALKRDLAPRLDRGEQIAHRGLAVAFDLLQLDVHASGQTENIGRLLDPTLLEEKFDLLLAKAFDVKGAARDEQFEMLDPLIRTSELAGAARARTFLAGGGGLAHHVG